MHLIHQLFDLFTHFSQRFILFIYYLHSIVNNMLRDLLQTVLLHLHHHLETNIAKVIATIKTKGWIIVDC